MRLARMTRLRVLTGASGLASRTVEDISAFEGR
jgi:hypothetical protein